jgi:hypothetical protein
MRTSWMSISSLSICSEIARLSDCRIISSPVPETNEHDYNLSLRHNEPETLQANPWAPSPEAFLAQHPAPKIAAYSDVRVEQEARNRFTSPIRPGYFKRIPPLVSRFGFRVSISRSAARLTLKLPHQIDHPQYMRPRRRYLG